MESVVDQFKKTKSEMRKSLTEKKKKYGFAPAVHSNVVENLHTLIPTGLTVASFRGMSDEVNIDKLEDRRDLRIVYPKIENDRLDFYLPNSPTAFKRGTLGILEPDIRQSEKIAAKDIDMVLVPGMGFDRRGARLGRGKGYYDRFLTAFSGLKIGIGSAAQVLDEEIPLEKHDVLMDVIVTDLYILKIFLS